MVLKGYCEHEFSPQWVTKWVPQRLPGNNMLPFSTQWVTNRPTMVNGPQKVPLYRGKEFHLPPKGSSMVLNGYREQEFSTQWVTNGPQMVTEERSIPPKKGHRKALKGYRDHEFFPKKWSLIAHNSYRNLVSPNRPQWWTCSIVLSVSSISSSHFLWTSKFPLIHKFNHHGNVAELLCHYLFCLPINFTVYIC